jgi:putative membrane protein
MKAPSEPWERLHHWTLWLPALVSLPQVAFAGVFITFAFGLRAGALISFWFLFLPAAAYHILRFLTFRFQVMSSEILIQEGWLWRQERRIPFSRIQDVKIQQGAIHQLVRLAKVEITTAGSEKSEVTLEVIAKERADQLKLAVTHGSGERALVVQAGAGPGGTTLVRLSVGQLLLGGATSRMAAMLSALIGVILYFRTAIFLGSALNRAEVGAFEGPWDWGAWTPFRGTILDPVLGFLWEDTLAKSVVFILLGFLYSLGVYLVRYWRYRLVRTGNLFTKAHGMLRFRSSSLAHERIQALKLEEGLLRRWFGLADVWIDSGGDRARVDDKKKREPLVPVIRTSDAYSLVREVFPDLLNAQPEWKRVSPKAIMRGTKKLWLLILVLLLGNVAPFGWFSLVILPAFPLAYFLNLKWYKNRGYWYDDRYLISRKGWFNRETLFLPIQVVQNVTLTQNPFDRRLGLATVTVDTAGQSNTGGGASISNLPLDAARRLQIAAVSRVSGFRQSGQAGSGRALQMTPTP